MTPAEREEQILSLRPLVIAMARSRHIRLTVPSVLFSDLVSAAWVGAIAAVDRFKPAQGNLLRTYARWKIAGALGDYMRSIDPVSRDERRKLAANPDLTPPITFSLTPRPKGEASPCDISDQRSLQAIHRIEARLDLAKLCKANPVKPRALRIVMRHAHGETMKNIGALEGIGEGRVSQICKATYARLRKAA